MMGFRGKKMFFSILVVLALLIMTWFVVRSQTSPQTRTTTRLLMGTLVAITTWGVPEATDERAVAKAFAEMSRIDVLMSRFQKQSQVSSVNAAVVGSMVPISAEVAGIIDKSLEVQKISRGAFDVGMAPLMDLWGFTNDPPPNKLPSRAALASWQVKHGENPTIRLVQKAGAYYLQLPHELSGVDLGGIAKGYAIDRAVLTLREEGITNAVVNAGGDLRTMGSKGGQPWRIGIQDPRKPEAVVAVTELTGELAMVTSGDYERYFMLDGVRYYHILDPKTGEPARSGLISVSVQASEAVWADALSTAFFVLGKDEGQKLLASQKGVEVMFIFAGGGHWQSPGFKGKWLTE